MTAKRSDLMKPKANESIPARCLLPAASFISPCYALLVLSLSKDALILWLEVTNCRRFQAQNLAQLIKHLLFLFIEIAVCFGNQDTGTNEQ